MSVIEAHPRRTKGGGFGDVVLIVLLVGMALAVVVTVVVIASGGNRSPQGPRGPGALDALQGDITAAGLVVCSRTDLADPRATDAVAARTLVVAAQCRGGQTATVQADAFADDADRDAAARSIEGPERTRTSTHRAHLRRPRRGRRRWSGGRGGRPDRRDAAREGRRVNAKLGILALAMINIAAIVSIRNLPVMAEYGWSMLALFALSIVVFLVPIAMVAAELGTGWPRDGGVYAWVKEAFGERAGFLAVWCDYAENVAWFPTVLSFMAASLAYAIDPSLANDKLFLVVVMLAFFWATTIVSLRGVGTSSWIGSVGTLAGSIIPAVGLVLLAVAYLAQGNPSEIPFSAGALVPDVQLEQPGVPRRDHPAVHRHGDGGLPRPRHPRPRAHRPARDRPVRRRGRRVLGGRLALPRDGRARERDQPGLRDDGALLPGARPARRRVGRRAARAGGGVRRDRPPRAVDPRARERGRRGGPPGLGARRGSGGSTRTACR